MSSVQKPATIILVCLGYYLFYYGLLTIKHPNTTFNNIKVPAQKQKLIIILIDALRLDMANIIREEVKYESLFFPMMVQPPTTTATKLKSLLSGYIPNIIEVKDSFSQQRIHIQHLFSEFGNPINSSVVFVGDDTWDQLLDFTSSTPMDSFNVWDLDTVDNEVYNVFNKVLINNQPTVLIGHLLGIDHAGHTFYPFHPEMRRKFAEYTAFITKTIKNMDNDTTLMIMGDHGMDIKGDHGGDSLLETMTALLVYSKNFGSVDAPTDILSSSLLNASIYTQLQETPIFRNIRQQRIILQVDLVPTISLLIGTHIPFSNLGTIIYELLPININYSAILASQIKYANAELNMKMTLPSVVNRSTYDKISRSILREASEQLNTFKPEFMILGIVMILLAFLLDFEKGKMKIWDELVYLPYLIVYASNSYIVNEQQISMFFVQISILQTFKQEILTFYREKSFSAVVIPLSLIFGMRLINNIVICREEFGPHCVSTFYHFGTTNSPLLLQWASISFIPLYYYTWDSLLLSILHWVYGMGEDGNWLEIYELVILANFIFIIVAYKSIKSKNPLLFIHSLCLLSCKISGFVGIAFVYFAQLFIKNPFFFCFASYNLFFILGHQATLSHIMWDKGFVLSMNTNWTAPIFVILNYFSSFLLFPKMVNMKILLLASSCICTFVLRKHLMAWKIFFPRWLLSMGDVIYIVASLLIKN